MSNAAMTVELPINARVFGAISRAFEAEGFTEDEAYDLAKRGAQLLTEPDKPAAARTPATDEAARASRPHVAAEALISPQDDLGRKIEAQTRALEGRLNAIHSGLIALVTVILFGFVMLAIVLHESLRHLAGE